MKKLMLMTGLLLSMSGAAMAEQQVYSPYPEPTLRNDLQGQIVQQAISGQSQQRATPNTYRIYPGREQYGQRLGDIPRHPGDYKDSVDRGTWSGGGTGERAFDIR